MPGLWGLKSRVAQTKQSALEKVGQSESTLDVKYNFEIERFTKHYENIKTVRNNAIRMNSALKEFSIAQSDFFESLSNLFHFDGTDQENSTLYEASLNAIAGVTEIDNARLQFEKVIHSNVLSPIKRYSVQFKEMKKRMEPWKTRRLDMDRYRRDSKIHKSKGRKDRFAISNEKFERAKLNFDLINNEIQSDLDKLWRDRIPFFEPIFASVSSASTEFYCLATGSMSQSAGLLGRIDKNESIKHAFVITPHEDSAAHSKSSKTLAPNSFSTTSSFDISKSELMVGQEKTPSLPNAKNDSSSSSPYLNKTNSIDTYLSPAMVPNYQKEKVEELESKRTIQSLGSLTEVPLNSPVLNKNASMDSSWTFNEDNSVFRVNPTPIPANERKHSM